MHSESSLVFGSYNCRGFNTGKTDFIKHILTTVDVLFLQEHWLSDCQLSLLAGIDTNFLCTGVSGFDSSVILPGRPYGGCAIFWRSDISFNVSVVKTDSRRLCAIRLFNNDIKLLLVNVYMPYESDENSTLEFFDQLLIIESLILSNIDCQIIVGGDFNVDFLGI
jgi:exonuclease III